MPHNINYQTKRRLSNRRYGNHFKPRNPRRQSLIEFILLILSVIVLSYFVAHAYELL